MNGFPYETQMMIRLLLALICGFCLGYERERHGVSAGLRTNMLVCLGSALIMIISKFFIFKTDEAMGNVAMTFDPTRIAAQIVTGVGFLGAGVILKDKGSIRGLTTAATLWFNAGVGMALGAGMIFIPLFCTAMGLAALTVLKRFQKKIRRDTFRVLTVTCQESERPLESLLAIFFQNGNWALSLSIWTRSGAACPPIGSISDATGQIWIPSSRFAIWLHLSLSAK
ncbi:MgtC/SapB family protein [Desulfovibrio sp. DV]|uniref:MgtC/SapB family protein n=1 Tax=Desulfovibrio sp. DV TaxID=1844708 RepID=UPI0020C9F427|nr:MgtC/SapB family protein [Desulfovibrio sp. DV]